MSRILRPIAFVLLTLAICFAWRYYLTANWLHVGVRRDLGELLPLYTRVAPIDLNVPARWHALLVAVAAGIGGVIGVGVCVARRFSTASCLLVALVAVWTTNVAVAYLRDDHAGFVRPFTRQGMEYHTDVPVVGDDPRKFIADYPELAKRRRISHHAGTHPPGGVLFLWAGQKLFGPDPSTAAPPRDPTKLSPRERAKWIAWRVFWSREPRVDPTLDSSVWFAVTFAALGVLPAFALAHLAGGASAARRMLPLYVVAPNLVIFGATSMDGVFLTFTLTALATGVAAARRRGWWWPILAGVALWFATFMTYAAIAVPVLLGCVVIADAIGRVAWRRPRRGFAVVTADGDAAETTPAASAVPWLGRLALRETFWSAARVVAVGVVFVGCQLVAQRAIGYDFRACAESAMHIDHRGLGVTGYESRELWACVSLGNALTLIFGGGVCATALFLVSLVRRRPLRDPAWRFGVAACAMLLILATSTLFTLETERVWLALTPVFLAAATRALRGWPLWVLVPAGLLVQTIWTEVNYYTWW